MKLNNTPLRKLVKHFACGNLDREQYVRLRARLLQRLEQKGALTQKDLEQVLDALQDPQQTQTSSSRYSLSDWVIIFLGLAAAIGLGVILYS